jgi:hypothetical protein
MSIGIYHHVQNAAASTWTITHNLGIRPVHDVLVVEGGVSTKILPNNVTHVNDNTLEITFSAPRTGEVRLAGGNSAYTLKTPAVRDLSNVGEPQFSVPATLTGSSPVTVIVSRSSDIGIGKVNWEIDENDYDNNGNGVTQDVTEETSGQLVFNHGDNTKNLVLQFTVGGSFTLPHTAEIRLRGPLVGGTLGNNKILVTFQ